jgi:hypothetical protein
MAGIAFENSHDLRLSPPNIFSKPFAFAGVLAQPVAQQPITRYGRAHNMSP